MTINKHIKRMFQGHRLLIMVSLCLFGLSIVQSRQAPKKRRQKTAERVYLEHADILDHFDPQPTLREWFRPATEEEEFRLRLELAYALDRHGREPNDMISMHVLKEAQVRHS